MGVEGEAEAGERISKDRLVKARVCGAACPVIEKSADVLFVIDALERKKTWF